MTKKVRWLLATIVALLGLVPTSRAVLMTSLENISNGTSGGGSLWQHTGGLDGSDGHDSSWLEGPMDTIGAFFMRQTDYQPLIIESRPLPQIGDIYEFRLFAKNNSGSGVSFTNSVKLTLKQELEGDTLNHDYLFELDVGKDGSIEFKQVITADQMRSGFSTGVWTQQIDNGFTGEYATGTIEVIAPDDDQDGLPNWWEELYFDGATNASPSAVCSNGINTVTQAYIAGLNPNDPTNTFSVSVIPTNTLQWSCVSGRVYSVYSTTNLLENFQPLETNIPWTCSSFTNSTDTPNAYFKIGVQLKE